MPADLPFPSLSLDAETTWEWPQPPYACADRRPPMIGRPEPCRIELVNGWTIEGELLVLDPEHQQLTVRRRSDEPGMKLNLSAVLRLTLLALWDVWRPGADAPTERQTADAQPRDYEADCGEHRLTGRTMGTVQQPVGWFLYSPIDEGRSVQRVFLPSATCKSLSVSKSVREKAAEHWVADREQLLAAVQAQRSAPVIPMGEALVDLGLVARDDVDRLLARGADSSDKPLGERLVDGGWISRSDLQTALAHKMGYPIVDVLRFPIEMAAVRKVPHRVLVEQRALPLMLEGQRLYVAVDDLQSLPALQSLRMLDGIQVVGVLAPQAALRTALATLPQRLGRDPWAHNVSTYF
jgi:Type II secretion system (T2SS), protein E, N-terminal domain